MRVTHRQLIGGGIAAIAATAFVGLLAAFSERPAQQQRRSDGTLYSLAGITCPDRPQLVIGPPFLRPFASAIPPSEHVRLGLNVLADESGPLTLWLNVRRPETDPNAIQIDFDSPLASYKKEIVNERGDRALLPVDPRDWGSFFVLNPWTSIPLSHFPRRGKELTIRLTAEGDRDPLEFRVPNPYAGEYPFWPPETLPARKSGDGLEVELTRLISGLPLSELKKSGVASWQYDASDKIWTRVDFKVRYQGRPDPNWIPTGVQIKDATGNDWYAGFLAVLTVASEFSAWFPGNLWDEPSWKLRFRFEQFGGDPTGARGVMRVRLPRRGHRETTGTELKIKGITIRSGLASGGGGPSRSKNGVKQPPASPWITCRIDGENSERDVRLAEVSGRRLRNWWDTYGKYIDETKQRFELPKDTPAGPIRLTFVVQKPRYLEFVAHAEQAKTPQAVKSR